jgi:hypothetical protein
LLLRSKASPVELIFVPHGYSPGLQFSILFCLAFRRWKLFFLAFVELCPTNETDALPWLCGRAFQNPGELFHGFPAGQPLVFIERALPHRKTDLALYVKVTAENVFFRCAKARDDVSASTRPAKKTAAFRSATDNSNRDHNFLFF